MKGLGDTQDGGRACLLESKKLPNPASGGMIQGLKEIAWRILSRQTRHRINRHVT